MKGEYDIVYGYGVDAQPNSVPNMVHAIGARTQGDDYQARVFWLNACRLLMPNSNVVRVVYENPETQFFDDVGVYYGCECAIERGEYCKSDHYQVKFHVDHSGRFSYESFIDPAFLGVKKKSLLQRVHQFVESQKDVCRLYIVAPWGIQDGDPLVDNVPECPVFRRAIEPADVRAVEETLGTIWGTDILVARTIVQQNFQQLIRPLRRPAGVQEAK
jgi:hypothetical protein